MQAGVCHSLGGTPEAQPIFIRSKELTHLAFWATRQLMVLDSPGLFMTFKQKKPKKNPPAPNQPTNKARARTQIHGSLFQGGSPCRKTRRLEKWKNKIIYLKSFGTTFCMCGLCTTNTKPSLFHSCMHFISLFQGTFLLLDRRDRDSGRVSYSTVPYRLFFFRPVHEPNVPATY